MATQMGQLNTGAIVPFQYKGRMIIADAITEYSDSTTLASMTNFKLIGETVGLAFDGSDASTEPWQSDAGVTVTTTVTDGTLSWTVDIMDLSAAQCTKWLGATSLTGVTSDFFGTLSASKLKNSVTQTLPFGFLNDEENFTLFFPKTKFITSINMVDNKFTIKMIITPEACETTNLSTCMTLRGDAYANVITAPGS